MSIKEQSKKEQEAVSLGIAVLAMTDSRTMDTDQSGLLLKERIIRDGHRCVARAIVADEQETIVAQLKLWIERDDIDVIVGTGGTGLYKRDVTPEAFRSLYEKEIESFSTVVHIVSFKKIGVGTMQARPTAGIVGKTLLFSIPGSTGACVDIWDGVLSSSFDSNYRPCNLVQLLKHLQDC